MEALGSHELLLRWGRLYLLAVVLTAIFPDEFGLGGGVGQSVMANGIVLKKDCGISRTAAKLELHDFLVGGQTGQ